LPFSAIIFPASAVPSKKARWASDWRPNAFSLWAFFTAPLQVEQLCSACFLYKSDGDLILHRLSLVAETGLEPVTLGYEGDSAENGA